MPSNARSWKTPRDRDLRLRRIENGVGPRDVAVWYQVNGSGTNKIYYHAESVWISLLHYYPKLHIILGGDDKAAVGIRKVLDN